MPLAALPVLLLVVLFLGLAVLGEWLLLLPVALSQAPVFLT